MAEQETPNGAVGPAESAAESTREAPGPAAAPGPWEWATVPYVPFPIAAPPPFAAATTAGSRPRGSLAALAPLAVIAAIVVATTLLASIMVLSAARPASGGSSNDPGSPAGTVQAWLTAMQDGDVDTADSYCTANFLSAGSSADLLAFLEITDATIGDSTDSGDSATVDVRMTLGMPELSGMSITEDWTVMLVRVGGAWKIDDLVPAY